MIEVDIRLIPFGIRSAARTIGSVRIVNDGTGTKAFGNYRIALTPRDQNCGIWKTGKLKGYDRSQDPYTLLLQCLAKTLGYKVIKCKAKSKSKKPLQVRGSGNSAGN